MADDKTRVIPANLPGLDKISDIQGLFRATADRGEYKPLFDGAEAPEDLEVDPPPWGGTFLLDFGYNRGEWPREDQRIPVVHGGYPEEWTIEGVTYDPLQGEPEAPAMLPTFWLYGKKIPGIPWLGPDPSGDPDKIITWLVHFRLIPTGETNNPSGTVQVHYVPWGYRWGAEVGEEPETMPQPWSVSFSIEPEGSIEQAWAGTSYGDFPPDIDQWDRLFVTDYDPATDRALVCAPFASDGEPVTNMPPYLWIEVELGTDPPGFSVYTDWGQGERVTGHFGHYERPRFILHGDIDYADDVDETTTITWTGHDTDIVSFESTGWDADVGDILLGMRLAEGGGVDRWHARLDLVSFDVSATLLDVVCSGVYEQYWERTSDFEPVEDAAHDYIGDDGAVDLSYSYSGSAEASYELMVLRNGEEWESLGAVTVSASASGDVSTSAIEITGEKDGRVPRDVDTAWRMVGDASVNYQCRRGGKELTGSYSFDDNSRYSILYRIDDVDEDDLLTYAGRPIRAFSYARVESSFRDEISTIVEARIHSPVEESFPTLTAVEVHHRDIVMFDLSTLCAMRPSRFGLGRGHASGNFTDAARGVDYIWRPRMGEAIQGDYTRDETSTSTFGILSSHPMPYHSDMPIGYNPLQPRSEGAFSNPLSDTAPDGNYVIGEYPDGYAFALTGWLTGTEIDSQ